MAKEYTAKTVEDALNIALNDLGITIEQAEYEVLEYPTKGFIGIGAKPAKIKIAKKKTDAEFSADFLEGLFEILKINATTQIKEESDERIVIELIATDSSQLIGYRGEVLDALQYLAGAVANKKNEKYKRVVVDCENYRDKREETLKSLAQKLANKAIKTSRKITLEPMNPFERRIIHSALINFEGVKTVSEGKDPNRFIAIIPDGYDPSKQYRKNNRFGGNKGSKDFKSNNRQKSTAQKAPAKKSGFGGGVFLGNSLKNND